MNIWIDLANSPHVLFFKPLIRELAARGHKIIVTHRDFAQTSELCRVFGIQTTEIGVHGGKGLVKKFINISGRALRLRKVCKGKRIDLGVGHNSFAHCLASRSLGIPYINIMDYEHQPANHISFRFANKVYVPFTFKLDDVRKYGVNENKLVKYPGLKEEVYLWEHVRRSDFWGEEYPELDSSKVMCIIRPPATMAVYHNFENPLFNDLIQHLLSQENVQIVCFPRTETQRQEFARDYPQMYISPKSVDGAQLVANSDLVISAGGTMNREAAVLGTPAYTIYAGEIGSVDAYLLEKKFIEILQTKNDFIKLKFKKKKCFDVRVKKEPFSFIINEIENFFQ